MSSFTQLSLCIASLLIVASVVVYIQLLRNPTPERLKNKQRILVWWVIFALCIPVFQLGLIAICLLICGLLFWSVVEIHSLFAKKFNVSNAFLLIGFMFVMSMLILRFPIPANVLFGLALISGFLLFRLSVKSSATIWAYCLYFGLALFSILLLSALAQEQSIDIAHMLLVLFFVTSVNDISQYLTGSVFGKTKIAPTLSPNKTVAGLVGGILVTSIAFLVLAPDLLLLSRLEALYIGGLIAIAGFTGDLLISKLKRELQVKHSGNTIAGHGGILDRIDSLLLIAPVFGLILLAGGYL